MRRARTPAQPIGLFSPILALMIDLEPIAIFLGGVSLWGTWRIFSNRRDAQTWAKAAAELVTRADARNRTSFDAILHGVELTARVRNNELLSVLVSRKKVETRISAPVTVSRDLEIKVYDRGATS
jgi:hypothetical protein